MTEYFNMDSFGSDLPSNWEALCEFLNKKADARIQNDEDHEEVLEDIWESFCAGDYDDDEDFPGYSRTYADYMRDHPDENLGWCKPYVSKDGRYAVAVNEGEIIEAITPEGHLPKDHVSPLTDPEIEAMAQAVNPDYDLYDGWDNGYILLQAMHETGCASCPFFGTCDAMRQEL